MALVILPGLNNLIEDISEEKKLPPNIVELALREALLKGYEKYRKTFYIGVNQDPFDEEYFSNFDVGLDLDEEGFPVNVELNQKNSKIKFLNGLLYEKSKDYLAINIKGKIKKIPFDEVLKISLCTCLLYTSPSPRD